VDPGQDAGRWIEAAILVAVEYAEARDLSSPRISPVACNKF